ncbi:MAG: glycoside hydrolase family 31 protein [Anaerolineae bacterium]|nr:glycoside hydrolase family 31 protein [Anaerolineae bacterium]
MTSTHLRTLLDPPLSPVDWVSSLETFDVIAPASILMRCETSRDFADRAATGIPSSIRLDFLTDCILRLRYAPAAAISDSESPMIAGRFDTPPALKVDEQQTNLKLQAGDLHVEITRRPFEMRICDPQERIVWRTRDLSAEVIHPNEVPVPGPTGGACAIGSRNSDRQCAFISLDLNHDEHIFGLGESTGRVDKRETFHLLWHEAGSSSSLKRIPFYMSTRGYGLFIHTANAVRCHIGDLDPTALAIVVDDTRALDLFVMVGPDMKQILPHYASISGQPIVPPRWTFGLWWSPVDAAAQIDVEASARALRERQLPGDVINWPSNLRKEDDHSATIERLRALGFRVATQYRLDAAEHGQKSARELLDQGVTALDVDLDQAATDDISARHRSILGYGRALSDLMGAADEQDRRALWTTTAWAGSQRYPIHGSCASVAGIEDLAGALRALLSLGMSGFPFCGLDFGSADPPDAAFSARWAQLCLFASHSRAPHRFTDVHPASDDADDGSEAILRKYAELRYRLMPYLYSEAIACGRTGLPLLRTLALQFQDDPTSMMIEDEFMFGRALLVAPVLDRTNRRNVYLPRGVWFDYWSKQPVHGGHWLDVDAPLDRLPMYVLGGAILPYAPLAQHTGAIRLDPLSLELYAGENTGSYTIQQADGSTLAIHYEFTARQLMLEGDPTPGEVELVIRDFGSKPQTVRVDGREGLHLLVNR